MKYLNTLFAFFGHPWAIEESKYEAIRRVLVGRSWGIPSTPEEIKAAKDSRRAETYQQVNRVAIIPVMGVLSQRVGAMEESSGGISTEAVGRMLDMAIADKSIGKILLQIDSPGGSVAGMPELAAKIRAARDQKRVVAVADSTAASGGYWLMSQATESYVTPSGRVGSIGVIAEYVDESLANEQAGFKSTFITAGKFKGENRGGPLTDEGAAKLQADVNHYYDMFVADVAKGRGVSETAVRSGYGEGRALVATEAKAAGLVDGIATMETVLKRMGVSVSAKSVNAYAAALEKDVFHP